MTITVFKKIFSFWRYRIVAAILFVVFVVAYLYSAQFIIWGAVTTNGTGFLLIPEWPSLMFRQRAPFLFEAIAVVRLGGFVTLFLSVPNLIIASLLGALVSLNMTLSYYVFRTIGLRGAKGAVTLIGTIPALLSGAACCTPTIIAVIGLQFTGVIAAAWPWAIPVSLLILSVSLWWSLKQASKYHK